jgi:hypothetical protein
MSLADIVSVTISTQTKTPTQKGFGTPMILAYHTLDPVIRVRTYSKLADMVTDGFGLYSGAYLAAVAIKSQSPSPSSWKIGRRSAPFMQQVQLDVLSATEGDTHSIQMREPGGSTTHAFSYTVANGDTTTTVAAALAAAMRGGATGPTGPTAKHSVYGATGPTGPYGVVTGATGPTATITTTGKDAEFKAGILADLYSWSSGLGLRTITGDPGLAADLQACLAEDDDAYGFCLDSNSAEEIAAMAAQVETQMAIFAADTADYEVATGATGDIGTALSAAEYARTVLVFNGAKLLSYAGAAALGGRLPDAPGSSTWCHKSYAGVPTYKVSGTQETHLKAKNVNYYPKIAGNGDFLWGKSSAGEYIDVPIFVDWLTARIQERVIGQLQSVKKIPYTDTGIGIVVNEVAAQLNEGVKVGGLTANPAPTVTAPKAADVSLVDKGNRFLPDINFQGILEGAIHATDINGVVSY